MSNSGSTLIDAVNAAYPAMAQFYASDWYVAEARNEGWYVGQGCAISASGTAGKVDMSAGTILIGTTEVAVAAVTAASTTITSLEDATNPKWVALEVDTSGALNFNAGTAAENPEKPTPTSARVVVAWLYVPANATAVDALTSSANGKAKIIDARQLYGGPSVTGWCYDNSGVTWLSPNTTVASGSNGVHTNTFIGSGTLNVASTTGFPTQGILNIVHSGTTSQVYYTGTTSTTFTGCALDGTDVTMATSDVVRLQGFSISSSTDYSATYKYARFRWAESATKKWNCAGTATFASSTTFVLFPASSDSTAIVAAAPDANSVAWATGGSPQGYPGWFNWIPFPTGYSALPTNTYYGWHIEDNTMFLQVREGTAGTSNATTKSYPAPFWAKTATNANWNGPTCITDNGTTKTTVCAWEIPSAGLYIVASTDGTSIGAWTNSGGARVVFGELSYPLP